MKTLITRLIAGDKLSDDEMDRLKALEAIDVDALTKERDVLKKALEDSEESSKGKELTLLEQIQNLQKQFATVQAEAKAEKAVAAKLARKQSINAIKAKNDIRFIPNVDALALDSFFESAFGDVDLQKEDDVAKVVNDFKIKNAGLILDTTGGGAGGNPGINNASLINGKNVDNATVDDVRKHLADAGVLR